MGLRTTALGDPNLFLRTPLIGVAKPSLPELGGPASSTARSLGFVPCMLGTEEDAACKFSLTPAPQRDEALFPDASSVRRCDPMTLFTVQPGSFQQHFN